MFSLSFDNRSMAEIAQFHGFRALLEPNVQQAMQEGGKLLQQAAVANTWEVFANPTGQLASTIVAIQDSAYEVQIGSDSPYARRRELGFDGADSLGRVYHDRPYRYMQMALDDNQQAVLTLIEGAVQHAFGQMGASF